jgi:small subunit ribosomal protein S4
MEASALRPDGEPADAGRLAGYYGISVDQLSRYIGELESAKDQAPNALIAALESRLDIVLWRLGWGRTLRQARLVIVSGCVSVNSRKIDMPAFRLKPGDCISIKHGRPELLHEPGRCVGDDEDRLVSWLASDHEYPEAVLLRLPEIKEVHLPFEIDLSGIIKHYMPR